MIAQGSLAPGLGRAGIFAGPTFVLTTTAAALYLQIPQPIVVSLSEVSMFLIAMLMTTLVGWIIALPVTAVCASLLAAFADHVPPFRPTLVWISAGGLLGASAAYLLDMQREAPALAFGIIATAAVCAYICRRRLLWVDCI